MGKKSEAKNVEFENFTWLWNNFNYRNETQSLGEKVNNCKVVNQKKTVEKFLYLS